MRNSAYGQTIILSMVVSVGFFACGGSSDAGGGGGAGGASTTGGNTSNGGISNTGGTKSTAGASATGGSKAAGGSSATVGTATGGARNTGGATTNGGATATGGAKITGGNSALGGATVTGGASTAGGNSSTGGAGGMSAVQQACAADCTIMTSLASLAACQIADCPTTCVKYYDVLAAVSANCSNAFLSVLTCGSNDQTGWTCATSSGITLPVPLSSCTTQILALSGQLTANNSACANALQAAQ